ncbi:MAG: hypothetical protein ACOZAA_03020 [Pseudomonadota bacterium]
MAPADKERLIRLFGPIADHTVAEIFRTGADDEALEEAAMRLESQDDVMGDLRKPLAGLAARVHDIVTRDPLYAADDRENRNG